MKAEFQKNVSHSSSWAQLRGRGDQVVDWRPPTLTCFSLRKIMKRTKKRLGTERLESRNLMAGDVGEFSPTDVNADGQTSPLDALAVINTIRSQRGSDRSDEVTRFDVDRDGRVTPLDALTVINEIKSSRTDASLATNGLGGGRLQNLLRGKADRGGTLARSGLTERLEAKLADRDVDPAVSAFRQKVKEFYSDQDFSAEEQAVISTLANDLVQQGIVSQTQFDQLKAKRVERAESRGEGTSGKGQLRSMVEQARSDGEVTEAEKATIQEAMQGKLAQRDGNGRPGFGRFFGNRSR
jgi:hypothetical protein